MALYITSLLNFGVFHWITHLSVIITSFVNSFIFILICFNFQIKFNTRRRPCWVSRGLASSWSESPLHSKISHNGHLRALTKKKSKKIWKMVNYSRKKESFYSIMKTGVFGVTWRIARENRRNHFNQSSNIFWHISRRNWDIKYSFKSYRPRV